MEAYPLRIPPGEDLRAALERAVVGRGCGAAFAIAGIGSLRRAHLRLAGASVTTVVEGDLEILTLAGSVCGDGSHLHVSVSDSAGSVLAGHVAHGCLVRTTAEVLLLLLPEWSFAREPDAATGFAELVVRRSS